MSETFQQLLDLDGWDILGLVGSGCFFGRLLQQWYLSERAGKPVVTRGYWIMSVLGTSLLLFYALKIQNLVFTLNHLVPFLIYIRQLVLHHRGNSLTPAEPVCCPHCGKAADDPVVEK